MIKLTQGCQILVASDFPSWESCTNSMLKRGGRSLDEVRFVDSGAKALTLVQASPPDLIIYYLWTFDLSGYEFCRRLNAVSALGKLTLLQGSVSPQLVYPEAKRAGAAGYLRQPFEPAQSGTARLTRPEKRAQR